MRFNEDSGIKSTTTLYLIQLGFQYLLLKNKVSVGDATKAYEMKEEVFGRVTEGNVEYKNGEL